MPEKRLRKKPRKPHANFPLTPLSNGQWGKKIRRKHYYFGPWDDHAAALQRYLEEKDDLFAGRRPKARQTMGITLHEMTNRFLSAMEKRLATKELSQRTYNDYLAAAKRICLLLGNNRVVPQLMPDDFSELRSKLAENVGLVRLGNQVRQMRVMFKWAKDNDWLEKPARFGTEFKLPSKRSLRIEQNAKPDKLFVAADLRKIIKALSEQKKAMILVGLNCAYGQSDISRLSVASLDLKTGWAVFPRPKTGQYRRCKLWPETIESLKWVIAHRPVPLTTELEDRVFLNRWGDEYVHFSKNGTNMNGISREFDRDLRRLDLTGEGRTFYALRHTFETIGGDCEDQVAVDVVMGHVPESDDMAAVYRKKVFDRRLIKVAEHVRKWLWPK